MEAEATIGSYVRSVSLGPLATAVESRLRTLTGESAVARIWAGDPSVWGATPATRELSDRLGWLDVADRVLQDHSDLAGFANRAREDCQSVVLCGMGGSSLAPEVFWRAFGSRPGYPSLAMLDSTVPEAIHGILPTDRDALFVISSKSGSTIETASFMAHFWNSADADPRRFVAITDRGSTLHDTATEKGFRGIFEGDPEVGGRFSALSPFGLVPAALIGVDVEAIVAGAQSAMKACRLPTARENPGAWLGAVMGEAAIAGRDKLTLLISPSLRGFELWAEQLVAESTGKDGKGLLPVFDAGSGSVDSYGRDRLFVSVGVRGDATPESESGLDALAEGGHPVVRLEIPSIDDLGGEFFRWEFATAVAAAVLCVNPFDQPNVAESKANTREVLDAGGAGPDPDRPTRERFEGFVSAVQPGDYVAILAYVAPSAGTDAELASIGRALQQRLGVAVTVGYGPRYLHSTGQFHKGGLPTGHFVQVVDLPGEDLPIPGASYTFGGLARAQARGDARALEVRGRPVMRLPSVAGLRMLVEGLTT